MFASNTAAGDRMFAAVAKGDIQLLASEDAGKLRSVRHSRSGGCLLHAAAAGGHLDAVQLLLSRTTLKVDITDAGGLTPLMVAAGRGHAPVVAALLHQGAAGAAADDKGATALHHAARSGSTDVIRAVLGSAPLSLAARTAGDGALPIHFAARSGSAPAVQALLSAGTAAAAATNNSMLPLHYAAASASASVVQLLLQAGGEATATAADKAGRTPLHMAVVGSAQSGADAVVLLLLKAGASATTKDGRGASPCDLATHALGTDAVRALPAQLHSSAQRTAQRMATRSASSQPPHERLPPIDSDAASGVLLSLASAEAAPFRAASATGPAAAFAPEALTQVAQLIRTYRVDWLLRGSLAPPAPPAGLRVLRSGSAVLRILTAQAEQRALREAAAQAHTKAASPAAAVAGQGGDEEDLLSLGPGSVGAGAAHDGAVSGGHEPAPPTIPPVQVTPLMRQLGADVAAGRALGVVWRAGGGEGGDNPATHPPSEFVLSWGSKWGLSAWPEHTKSAAVCLWTEGGVSEQDGGAVGGSDPPSIPRLSQAELPQAATSGAGTPSEAASNTYFTVLHRTPEPPFQLRAKCVSHAGHSKWCDKIDVLPPGEGGEGGASPAADASEDLLGMGSARGGSSPGGVYTPPTMSRFGGATPSSALGASARGQRDTPVKGGGGSPAAAQLTDAAAEAAFKGDMQALCRLEAEGGLVLGQGGVPGATPEGCLAQPDVALAAADGKKRGLVHHAARSGQLKTVQWLLKGVKGGSTGFDSPDVVHATPLLLACVGGYMQVARELHAQGASLAAADAKGYGAVHYAVLKRRWGTLRWLLESGAAPDRAAAGGATPATLLGRDKEVQGGLKQLVGMMLQAASVPSPPEPPFQLDTSRYSLAVGIKPGRLLPGQMPSKYAEVGVSPKFWPTWGDDAAKVELSWTPIDPLSPDFAPPDGATAWNPAKDGKLATRKCAPVAVQLHSLAPASTYRTRWRLGGVTAGPWSPSSQDMATRAADDRHIIGEGELPKLLAATLQGGDGTKTAPTTAAAPAAAAAAAQSTPSTAQGGGGTWQQDAADAIEAGLPADTASAVRRGVAWGVAARGAQDCVRLVSAALLGGGHACAVALLGAVGGGADAGAVSLAAVMQGWKVLVQSGGLKGGWQVAAVVGVARAACGGLLWWPGPGVVQGGLLALTLLVAEACPAAVFPTQAALDCVEAGSDAWGRDVGGVVLQTKGGSQALLSCSEHWPSTGNVLHVLAFAGSVPLIAALRACSPAMEWAQAAAAADAAGGTPLHRAMQGAGDRAAETLAALWDAAHATALPSLLRHAVGLRCRPALEWLLARAEGCEGGVVEAIRASGLGAESLLHLAVHGGDDSLVGVILAALQRGSAE